MKITYGNNVYTFNTDVRTGTNGIAPDNTVGWIDYNDPNNSSSRTYTGIILDSYVNLAEPEPEPGKHAFYFSECRNTHTHDSKISNMLNGVIPTDDTASEYTIVGNNNANEDGTGGDNNGNPRSYQRNCFQNGIETGTDTPYCVLKFNEPRKNR